MASKILNLRFLTGLLILTLSMSAGCKKKDRLTVSTSALSINPAATALLKGETLTLTARRVAPNGALQNLASDWTVSGCASDANLNVNFGESVVFTAPNSLCDVLVTATFGGEDATSQIAIVTYKPATTIFEVYSDQLPPASPGIAPDIFASPSTIDIQQLSTGYTPQGNNYQHTTSMTGGQAWGVTLDKSNVGYSKDLSAFNTASAKLKFAIRLARPLSGEFIRFEIKDVSSTAGAVNSNSGFIQGFSNSSTDWQEISIPIQNFSPAIAFNQVNVPFDVVTAAISSPLTFDIDAVRWEP